MTQTATPATRPQMTAEQQAMRSIKGLLEQSKSAIASRLPKHLTADRILKTALTAINKTPKLLECTKESLMLSIMQAAELGLEPGGALGEGYLVPYKSTCQFIPGYRGLISLARRSGQILSIEAHVVYEKDEFNCTLGLDPKLEHTPAWEEVDPGKMRFVYAVAKLKDGGVQFEVMSRAQVEAIRQKSKAGNNGPWVDHYDEMARKTVVRRLFKYLPVSVEMARAMELQAGAEAGEFTGLTLEPEAGSQVIDGQVLPPEVQGSAAGPLSGAEGAAAGQSRADKLKANLSGPAPATSPATDEVPL